MTYVVVSVMMGVIGASALVWRRRIAEWTLHWHQDRAEATPRLYRAFPMRLGLSEGFVRRGTLVVALFALIESVLFAVMAARLS